MVGLFSFPLIHEITFKRHDNRRATEFEYISLINKAGTSVFQNGVEVSLTYSGNNPNIQGIIAKNFPSTPMIEHVWVKKSQKVSQDV